MHWTNYFLFPWTTRKPNGRGRMCIGKSSHFRLSSLHPPLQHVHWAFVDGLGRPKRGESVEKTPINKRRFYGSGSIKAIRCWWLVSLSEPRTGGQQDDPGWPGFMKTGTKLDGLPMRSSRQKASDELTIEALPWWCHGYRLATLLGKSEQSRRCHGSGTWQSVLAARCHGNSYVSSSDWLVPDRTVTGRALYNFQILYVLFPWRRAMVALTIHRCYFCICRRIYYRQTDRQTEG